MTGLEAPFIQIGDGGNIVQDSRCGAKEWSGAKTTDLGNGVMLLAMQDINRVYLCVVPPPNSLGTLDIYVQAGDLEITDLHMSAQVGERVRARVGWPEFEWNNFEGWYGTAVPFSGMTRTDTGETRVSFLGGSAREIIIEKTKFGPGPWRMRFDVRALGQDRAGRVIFPLNTKDADPQGWSILEDGCGQGCTAP